MALGLASSRPDPGPPLRYLADDVVGWIFYINLPVGIVGFFPGQCVPVRPAYLRRARDRLWARLMVAGFAACSWSSIGAAEMFASGAIVARASSPSSPSSLSDRD